jgi:hypothetical protein
MVVAQKRDEPMPPNVELGHDSSAAARAGRTTTHSGGIDSGGRARGSDQCRRRRLSKQPLPSSAGGVTVASGIAWQRAVDDAGERWWMDVGRASTPGFVSCSALVLAIAIAIAAAASSSRGGDGDGECEECGGEDGLNERRERAWNETVRRRRSSGLVRQQLRYQYHSQPRHGEWLVQESTMVR